MSPDTISLTLWLRVKLTTKESNRISFILRKREILNVSEGKGGLRLNTFPLLICRCLWIRLYFYNEAILDNSLQKMTPLKGENIIDLDIY